MSINLIVAIIAYIVAIGAGFYYFKKKQYKLCVNYTCEANRNESWRVR